jgi:hypothetical protein
MITPTMSSIEVASLITAAFVLVYTLRNSRWWRSARPRLPW